MQPPAPAVRGIIWQSASRTNTVWSTQNHTPGATHTWGTPTQLVASTARDSNWLMIRCNTATVADSTRSDFLFRLMAGGASSEYTIIGPIEAAGRNTFSILLPIYVPAGTRLSVAVKSARNVAYTFGVEQYQVQGGGEGFPTGWVAYGLTDDGSNSYGTLVTPGNTNTWGSWTALTTSTTYAHSLWVPMTGIGTGTGFAQTYSYRFQFAVASTTDAATCATNGTTFEGGVWSATTATDVITDNMYGTLGIASGFMPYYAPRPAGSAVSARAMCSSTAETNMTSASILAAVM